MEAIIAKADELAKAIRGSEIFKTFMAAQKSLTEDEETRKLMEDVEAHRKKLQEKEKNQQPIEVEEKRRQQALHEQVQSNVLVQNLLKAETDLAMLMGKVNSTIEKVFKPE